MQIGHSSRSTSLNNCSSCSSATLLSHAFLCFFLCFFLHAALQYFTILHLLHTLLMSLPFLPQLAHTGTTTSSLSSVFILFNFPITSHTSSHTESHNKMEDRVYVVDDVAGQTLAWIASNDNAPVLACTTAVVDPLPTIILQHTSSTVRTTTPVVLSQYRVSTERQQ